MTESDFLAIQLRDTCNSRPRQRKERVKTTPTTTGEMFATQTIYRFVWLVQLPVVYTLKLVQTEFLSLAHTDTHNAPHAHTLTHTHGIFDPSSSQSGPPGLPDVPSQR